MELRDEDIIDYPAMIDGAMRGVVRDALKHACEHGLPGEHHFFVSFQTQFPGVHISPMLRERYPQEMTIVVQHQFWDLHIEEDFFTISLSFNNIPETLVIPFDAMTAFADPSIKFGLQFHGKVWEEAEEDDDERVHCPATGKSGREPMAEASFEEEISEASEPPANDDKVLSIDAFRKK